MVLIPHKSAHQNERESAALRLDSLMSVKEFIRAKINQKRDKSDSQRKVKTVYCHNNSDFEG